MKLFRVILALALIPTLSCADSDLESYAWENRDYEPSAREADMMNRLEERDSLASPGSATRAGEVVFTFGGGRHSVVCAVLELCDIALEPGEHIQGAQIGDAERWNVDTAVSGSADGQVEHLVVKPHDSGLKTSLMITTDRRTYHLSLKSSLKDYMPSVRFIYPDSKLNAYSSGRIPLRFNTPRQDAATRDDTDTGYVSAADDGLTPSTSAGTIYDFEIGGDEEICPVSVAYDGTRTFINLRDTGSRLPALMLKNSDGSLHSANYRLKGNTYVVDGLVRRAVLILGIDGGDLKAEISYLG